MRKERGRKEKEEVRKGKGHGKGGTRKWASKGQESRESQEIETRTWTRTKQCKRNRTGARIRRRKGIKPKAKSQKPKAKSQIKEETEAEGIEPALVGYYRTNLMFETKIYKGIRH